MDLKTTYRILTIFLLLLFFSNQHITCMPLMQEDTVMVSAEGIQAPGRTDDVQAAGNRYTGIFARIFDVFEKSPTLVLILYIVIVYSIITLIVLTVFILLNRSRMQKEQILRQELNEQYQQLLIDYLFDEEQRKEIFRQILRIASNNFRRQILINQIIELSVNMQGKVRDDLRNLYLDVGLKKDSLRKAYSKKWHENVKGFRELAYMNIRSANDRIIECLNAHNQILRMEAQIALVRLSDENPYTFLNFLEKPLAKWEQITIHELLMQHNLNVPDFSEWFDSENLSIVKFSLQMVAWFGQKEAIGGVIRLLSHPDEEVRMHAIRTCGKLGENEALPHLAQMYDRESYKIRMELLKAFAQVPDEQYLEFLNGVLDKEEDVQLQILATKAMEKLDEPGIARLIKLMKKKSEYRNYQIIIRHVLDGRIY
jgi:HEAT repeat protein